MTTAQPMNEASGQPLAAKWPSTLRDMMDVIMAHFSRQGLDEQKAQREAEAIVVNLAHYFGGRQIYLPQGNSLKRAIRNMDIARCANGRNTAELAAEFNCTERTIQMIVAEQARLRRSAHSQGSAS